MTRAEMTEYFVGALVANKIDFPDPDKHVDKAITVGLKDFHGAYDWNYKRKEATLTITGEATDLPSDFEGFIAIREKASNRGYKTKYLPYERFLTVFPRLENLSTGNPNYHTIFYDNDADRWQISFYPQFATGSTAYLSYVITTVADVINVPEKLQPCLQAFVAKYVFPHGTPARSSAYIESLNELKLAQIIDNPDQSSISVMGTGADLVNRSHLYYVP